MQKTFVPVVYYLSELNRKMIMCVCRSPLSALHIFYIVFYIVTDRMICCLFFSSIDKVKERKYQDTVRPCGQLEDAYRV